MLKINLQSIEKDDRRVVALSEVPSMDVSKILIDTIMVLRDRVRKQYESAPKSCDDDLTEDIVFQLGAVWAFNMVLAIPDDARALINKLKHKEI